jgi:anthranilate phosphoribosyltransferase
MAEVLARRGTRARLFRGEDGLDELTTTGSSVVLDVRGGKVFPSRLDPAEHGIPRASPVDLRGGDPADAARVARAILGGEQGPKRDVVLLNAGAALEVAGAAADLDEAIALASASLDDGSAGRTLERWIAVSNA